MRYDSQLRSNLEAFFSSSLFQFPSFHNPDISDPPVNSHCFIATLNPSPRPIHHCIPLPRANTCHLPLDHRSSTLSFCFIIFAPLGPLPCNFGLKNLSISTDSQLVPFLAHPHPKDEIQSFSEQAWSSPAWFLYLAYPCLLTPGPSSLLPRWLFPLPGIAALHVQALHKYHFLRELPSDRTSCFQPTHLQFSVSIDGKERICTAFSPCCPSVPGHSPLLEI